MKTYDVAPLRRFHPELGLLAAALEDSTREWRENLGRVNPKAVIWQAYPNGPSIGGLLLHLIDCEAYWLKEVGDGEPLSGEHPATIYNMSMDQYKPFWPAPPARPLSWYLKLHDEVRADILARIQKQTNPKKRYPRRRIVATYRWILVHVLEHDSYTGGQAVLLHEMWKKVGRRGGDKK